MDGLETRCAGFIMLGSKIYRPSYGYRESNGNYADAPTTPWVISVPWQRSIIQG